MFVYSTHTSPTHDSFPTFPPVVCLSFSLVASRENKNRFFLAYLHLLVKFGVFDIIELHFGLKGHTHDGENGLSSSLCTPFGEDVSFP